MKIGTLQILILARFLHANRPPLRSKTLYSAARACNELGFAAETMKS